MSDLLAPLGAPAPQNAAEWGTVHPPRWAAAAALAMGSVSVVVAVVFRDSIDWFGWALGFGAVVSGIVFRWILRQRQMLRGFTPDFIVGRIMLFGVMLGFVGIVLNAYFLAQRATP